MVKNINQENVETIVQSHSYVYGGLIGSYDFVTQNMYNPTGNPHFQEYIEHLDEEYFTMGYDAAYYNQNIFQIYTTKTPEELLEIIDNASKPYECIIQGGIKIEEGHFSIINEDIVEGIMNKNNQIKTK